MIIIFDYYRTLFNPDTDSLYAGVIEVVKKLSQKNDLFLVSRNEPGRATRLKEFGIHKYFQKSIFVEEKTKEAFETLAKKGIRTIVVGDRVKQEIALGNQLGLTTVWVRQGKFADELPSVEGERPNYMIQDIRELTDIIAIL